LMRGARICGVAAALTAAGPAASGQDATRSRQTAIATAAALVAPAVVSVNVLRRERRVAADPFDLFFMPRGYEQTVEGYGSGFIVPPDGLVITNQHVTQGAEQIVVTARDGRDFPAKVLGEDPLTDIAVLKIDGASLPVAPLAERRLGRGGVRDPDRAGGARGRRAAARRDRPSRVGGARRRRRGGPARLEAGGRSAGDTSRGERSRRGRRDRRRGRAAGREGSS